MSAAEVDGNRTRRTGIARPNRFEGGGAHQVPRHLHPRIYPWRRVTGMKRLLLLLAFIALATLAARQLKTA